MYLPAIKILVLLIYLDISVFGANCPSWMTLYDKQCLECPPGQSGSGCLPCSSRKFGPDCALDCHCASDCNPVTGECLDPSLGCENINYNGSAYNCQLKYEPVNKATAMAQGATLTQYNSTYQHYTQGPQAFDRDYSTVAYTDERPTTERVTQYVFVTATFADIESHKRLRLIHFYLSEEAAYADQRGEFTVQFVVSIPGRRRQYVNCNYNKAITAISHRVTTCPPCEADAFQVARIIGGRISINKMAVAELEVFVCAPGTYGPNCEYACPLHCKNNDCDINTGTCSNGCDQRAWTGTYCNIFGLFEVSFPLRLYSSPMIPVDMLMELYISVSSSYSGSQEFTIDISSPISTCNVVDGDWITLGDINKTLYYVTYTYANHSKVLKFNVRFNNPVSSGVDLKFEDPNMPHIPLFGATVYPAFIPVVQECLTVIDIIYADITLENPVGALQLVRYMDSNVTVTYSWKATYTGNVICPPMNITHYEWNIATPSTVCWLAQTESIELPPGTNISQEVFVIPAFSLLHGVYEVGVNVHALSDTEEPFYRFTKRNIEIIQGPIVAALTGLSDRDHYWDEELVLNASLSYDKDLVLSYQVFNYSWSCILVTGEMCVFDQRPSVDDTLPFTDPVFNFSSHALTVGSSYVFTVNVSYPGKGSSNASQTVSIIKSISKPKGGNCFITPDYGFAVLTDFKVTCENYTDTELPLTYRLYRVEIDTTEKLLHSGASSTMSRIELAAGEKENNMVDLKVEIVNALGLHTDVNISAQVLPPDAVKTQDTNDTVVNDVLYAVENVMKDFNVTDTQETLSTESVQKLVAISTVLNIENEGSTRNDTNNTRLERRQTVRAQIVTYLANSSIPDIDTLMQVADLTNDVLNVSSEVTETIQDKSVALFENLADSFKTVPKTNVSTTRKTAETILHAISNSLKIQTVRVTEKEKEREDEPPVSGGEPGDTDVVDEQAQKLKLKTNNKKMLSAVESVVNTVTETVLEPEVPLTIKDEDLTLSVTRSEGLGVADMKYSEDRILGTNQKFTVDFTLPDSDTFMDVIPEIKNSTFFVQVLILDENPYVWDDSYKNVTTPVMSLVIKDENLTELAIKNLKQPIEIRLSTNREGNEIQPFTLTYMYDPETNRTVSRSGTTNIVKVSIPHGSDDTLMIYVQPVDQNVTLLVYLSEYEEDVTPDQTRLNGIPIPHTYSNDFKAKFLNKDQSLNMLILNATMLTTEIFYMGISVMDDQSIDVNISVEVNDTNSDGLSSDNMTIALGTFSSSCLFYNTSKDKWVGDDCIMSPFSSMDTLQCWCDHLSVIAGGFLVLPYAIDPIADIKLFLTFFSNPVIVSTVVAIWFIYLVMLLWARRKDKKDFSKAGIHVLHDNKVDEKYLYIIGVVTGWWNHAGTTANVHICLEGKDYHSDNRMLSDGSSKHFDTGNEDWFLLTTSICLGDLKSITVWHDNAGRDPTWFLKQILVQDVQTKETWHFIHNNWLGVFGDHISKMIQIPAVMPEELAKRYYYQFSLRSSLGLQNNHLWISIVCGNENVNFTRAQRLSCALSLLLTTMLTSLMFHGIPTDDPADQLKTDVISFSWADLIIGIQSGLIMFPINLIMVLLFSKLAPKAEPEQARQTESGINENSQIKDVESFDWLSDQCSSTDSSQSTTTSKQKKKPFRFPWWFIYIAWGLVLCTSVTSSYFVMLYGLKYGYKKSLDWLVSFFTAFFQSTCITQPLKVVTIAVLLSIIFKKPVEFENLSERKIPMLGKGEEYVQKDLLKKYGVAFDSEPVPSHDKKPLSESQLKSVKEQLILESNMQIILRDLIVYLIYVFVVLFMVHGYRNINQCYYNTKTIEDIFIHESSYSGDVLFQEVSTVSDLWQYLSTTVIPNLVTGEGSQISGDMMYLLGTARLRQKRQVPGSCYFPSMVKSIFHDTDCVVSYTNLVEETRSFNKSWLHTAESDPMFADHWTYQTATQLKTLPYVGRFASYLGSGYVFELPLEKSLALQSLETLQKDEWIDKFTASLFVEFTLYNPHANLFSVVLLLFENTNIGTIFPKYDIFTAKLYHYTDGFEKFIAACEVLFVLVTFTMTMYEIKRYRRLKRSLYFSDPWNCIEIIILGLSYTVIILFIQQLVTVYLVMTEYQANGSNKFTSFSTAVFWDSILRYVLAALVVLVIVKVLKLFSFHNKTKVLTQAIQTCWKPVLNVAVIIIICMIAFTHLGFFLFGRSLNDYHAFGNTILTLFNFILGVTDFYGLVEADRVNGPWFYFVFYSTMHYCLITVMIAVIVVSMKMSRHRLRVKQKSVFYYLLCHISNILGLGNYKA